MTKGPYNLMPDGLVHSLRRRKARVSGLAFTVMFEIQGMPLQKAVSLNIISQSSRLIGVFFSREFQCRQGFF